MHCVRRAALRAACSSSRFVAVPRQQIAVIGIQNSKASVRPASALPLSRYFSQTTSVAAEEDARNAESSYDNAGEETEAPQVNALRSTPTESERAAQDACSIFISNMTFDATDVHLKEAFGKYGDIMSCNIARDGRGLSRGFGFITFSSKEAASRAVDEAHDSFWHGRRINVALRKQSDNSNTRLGSGARQGGISTPTNSLYIGNIPYEASDADLNQLFRSLDNVRDVRVAVDRNTGWPRGFAHADFLDVESAKKAHDHLLEVTLNGRTLRVDYAENRTRNDQQRR